MWNNSEVVGVYDQLCEWLKWDKSLTIVVAEIKELIINLWKENQEELYIYMSEFQCQCINCQLGWRWLKWFKLIHKKLHEILWIN